MSGKNGVCSGNQLNKEVSAGDYSESENAYERETAFENRCVPQD